MTPPPPDGSRDRRIEEPSNLWLIHPAARRLLPVALAFGISANAVSLAGLALGVGAAWCFARWPHPGFVLAGLALAIGWLVADGLDGMIARATGSASALGRFLDGVCDHGVFLLIYVALVLSLGGGLGVWLLAVAAGVAHGVQSSLYEGQRARFHRRLKGLAEADAPPASANALVRAYDRLAGLPQRLGRDFERLLARTADPVALGRAYAARAVPAMRGQALLTANVRVYAIALACLAGQPRLFWWAELAPLSLVALVGLARHRAAERAFVAPFSAIPCGEPLAAAYTTRDPS